MVEEGQRGMEHDDADVAGGEEGGDEAEAPGDRGVCVGWSCRCVCAGCSYRCVRVGCSYRCVRAGCNNRGVSRGHRSDRLEPTL